MVEDKPIMKLTPGIVVRRLLLLAVGWVAAYFLLLFLVWPYGYVDRRGVPVVNLDRCSVDECYEFSNDMAVTRAWAYSGSGPSVNGWSYINAQGNPLTLIDSDYLGAFSEGLAMLKSGEKCGYIDKRGKFLIPPQFEDANDYNTRKDWQR